MRSNAMRNSDFEEVVARHYDRMLSIAYRMLGNMEEAKDMAQDAFIRLWNLEDGPEGEPATFRFLARTLTNLCIDRLRKRNRWRFLSLSSEPTNVQPIAPDDPARRASDRELVQLVLKTAERLKAKQKAVFVLRDIEGCSVRETAEILGCAENNVLVTLHLARKNLRKWLKSRIEGPDAAGGGDKSK